MRFIEKTDCKLSSSKAIYKKNIFPFTQSRIKC